MADFIPDETVWLRDRVERLRGLLKFVTDDRAVGAIEQLIAEAEERLAARAEA